MKRPIYVSMTVLIVLAVGSQSAFAALGLDANDDIKVSYWKNGQSQGPFAAKITEGTTTVSNENGDAVNGLSDFLTFCVEVDEHFYPGNWYNITAVNYKTENSGMYASGYAAFVYETFLNNFHAGYSNPYQFNSTRGTTTTGVPAAPGGYTWAQVLNAFQDAIWAGMVSSLDRTLIGGNDGNSEYAKYHNNNPIAWTPIYTDLGIDLLAFDAMWDGPDDDTIGGEMDYLGQFKVLNLNTNNQDMCVLMPTEGSTTNIVPEPATLAVWSVLFASAMGVTVWRRRNGMGGAARPQWSEDTRQAILSIVDRK